MLASQREHFDMPREVCYLNAAAYGPLPLRTLEAGRHAVGHKGKPWTLGPDQAAQQFERARRAAARLINADPDDVAIISSVGYGVSTAGKLIAPPPGSRVLLLAEDHSSPSLEWMTRAETQGFIIEAVARPEDGDWTAALLTAIARPGAPPISLASISSVHWADGGAIDLAPVAKALRAQGAALLVDATHGAGVMDLDVRALDPDILIFPTYKWVLGPYGRAFIYVAKRLQDGTPLEQTASGRRGIGAENTTYMRDTRYVPNARRFDMGERDHFISLEMASIGMEMMAEWGGEAILARLKMLTDRLADGIRSNGIHIADEKTRAPHILCLRFADGMPANLCAKLESARVYVAARLGRMRISPHVYNDEADVDRFLIEFRKALS